MTIQEKMIAFRAKHDLSQKKAAELAKINLMTWNNIERGIQNPSQLTLTKLRLVLEREEDNESINKPD